MKVVVTGGAGFIGSHVAEYYAGKGCRVIVFDNLSRQNLLGKRIKSFNYNWEYLARYKNIKLVMADIRNFGALKNACQDADLIVHTAAQTAVTASVINPRLDFEHNAIGAFNVLEAARNLKKRPVVIFCSTNKVYGDNVNKVPVREGKKRYKFTGKYRRGIDENFSIDLCEHTPYGSSKLSGDIYAQDYAHLYGLRIGVFRMSCIYGPRQLGLEDQGWVAWFTIAAIAGKPITIFGDGKQVRDVLYVTDLVEAYDLFRESNIKYGVYNIGGGYKNTLSLLELLDILKQEGGRKPLCRFKGWRPSDQKVYISDLTRIKKELNWRPRTTCREGVSGLISWVKDNKDIF
jgi:CDP-paratose 2-epimerase